MQPHEYKVQCLAPLEFAGGNERLHFTLDGVSKSADIKIGALSKTLVARLPDHVIDLIEIATLVYAIDSSVSRGGTTDQKMGAKWHRKFNVKMAVRRPDLWNRQDIKSELEETLMFLSDDRFRFTFVKNSAPPNTSKWFKFEDDNGWQADSIVMFSGGLDSFAGVLEEIVERGNRVALISHFSSTKIEKVQKELQAEIGRTIDKSMFKHIPIKIQLKAGTLKEGTHRTRSFLFAALGVANAVAFGLNRVFFFENGVVSLNLSPVTNAVGTRATRTTHPQTLTRFSNLFSKVFDAPYKIENPFFWRTKKDVVETIAKLEFKKAIALTRSCADVHNITKMHPHCGRCSQCIDRRFAMLAAGLERFDPAEAYKVDLMEGHRENAIDRENALSYMRSALFYTGMSPVDLEQRHPQIARSVAHLGESEETSLKRLAELLRRHGKGVVDVMERTLGSRAVDEFEPDTLPRMFGEHKRSKLAVDSGDLSKTFIEPPELETVELVFENKGRKLTINGEINVTAKSTRSLLFALATEHLRGAGGGLELEDYPAISVYDLMDKLGLTSDENVRRRISRSRFELCKIFNSVGFDAEQAEGLIETLPRHGYRLAPDRVKVRIKE